MIISDNSIRAPANTGILRKKVFDKVSISDMLLGIDNVSSITSILSKWGTELEKKNSLRIDELRVLLLECKDCVVKIQKNTANALESTNDIASSAIEQDINDLRSIVEKIINCDGSEFGNYLFLELNKIESRRIKKAKLHIATSSRAPRAYTTHIMHNRSRGYHSNKS